MFTWRHKSSSSARICDVWGARLYDHGGCLGSHVAFKYTVSLGERGYERKIDLTIPCPKGGSAPSGGGSGGGSGGSGAGRKAR